MWSSLKKLIFLLDAKEKFRALIIIILMLLSGLLDMLGVASILPFMSVLADPTIVTENDWFAFFFHYFEFKSVQDFLYFLGKVVFLLLVSSLALKAGVTYAQLSFSMTFEYGLGCRLVKNYISQQLTWFIGRHSADLGKTVLSEVSEVTQRGLMPLLSIVSSCFSTFALIILLLLVDPVVTAITTIVFGAVYFGIYLSIKLSLARIGNQRLEANNRRFTVLQEAFAGFRELKIYGLEERILDEFSQPAKIFANHSAKVALVSYLPKFALEAIAFGGLLFFVLYQLQGDSGVVSVLPTLSLFAFAGYRLLPALNVMYANFAQLKFVEPSINALYADLSQTLQTSSSLKVRPDRKKMSSADISFQEVSFHYPGSKVSSLHDVSLEIKDGANIGFVGETGSGKTTAANLLVGLLSPSSGQITVGGKMLEGDDLDFWKSDIGFVPQSIYLTGQSIAENIAFGVDPADIEYDKVRHVAAIAQIDKFIDQQLESGFHTLVGEQGARLSGGQRQRIGIARALYREPKLLVFDEATSALDNATELAVCQAVTRELRGTTIVNITHRFNSLATCDTVAVFDQGRVIDQGTIPELLKRCSRFVEIMQAST